MIINAETIRRVYGEPKPLWVPLTEDEKFQIEKDRMEREERARIAWAHRDGVIVNMIFIGVPLFMVCYYWALYFTLVDFNPLRMLGCLTEMVLFYILIADGEDV